MTLPSLYSFWLSFLKANEFASIRGDSLLLLLFVICTATFFEHYILLLILRTSCSLLFCFTSSKALVQGPSDVVRDASCRQGDLKSSKWNCNSIHIYGTERKNCVNLKAKAELVVWHKRNFPHPNTHICASVFSLSGLETMQGQQHESPCDCHSVTFHCAAVTRTW